MYWQVQKLIRPVNKSVIISVDMCHLTCLVTWNFNLRHARSIRQPNPIDMVEEIDYQSPSQWGLTLIHTESTLSLIILTWLILFQFQFLIELSSPYFYCFSRGHFLYSSGWHRVSFMSEFCVFYFPFNMFSFFLKIPHGTYSNILQSNTSGTGGSKS